MQNLVIKQQMTFEDFTNSAYPSILTGTEYAYLINREHASWSKYDGLQVFICEADPNIDGYGKDFKVYFRYNADGINFLKRLSYTSHSMSNGGLQFANCARFGSDTTNEQWETMIERGLFTSEQVNQISFGDEYFDKCASNRKIMRKMIFKTFH
jgi:hypothetical protein